MSTSLTLLRGVTTGGGRFFQSRTAAPAHARGGLCASLLLPEGARIRPDFTNENDYQLVRLCRGLGHLDGRL